MSNRVNKYPDLIDGVAMSVIYDTFEVPSVDKIKSLEAGDFIKIGIKQNKDKNDFGAERFWCEIMEKSGDNFIGRVDNDLVMTHLHMVKYNDIILIQPQNILSIG